MHILCISHQPSAGSLGQCNPTIRSSTNRDTGSRREVGVRRFVHANEQINFFGDMPGISDWEVKLQATGPLGWGVRIGAYYNWLSGDHYTPTYTIDRRNHDSVLGDGTTLDPDLIYGISGETIWDRARKRGQRDRRPSRRPRGRVDHHQRWPDRGR